MKEVPTDLSPGNLKRLLSDLQPEAENTDAASREALAPPTDGLPFSLHEAEEEARAFLESQEGHDWKADIWERVLAAWGEAGSDSQDDGPPICPFPPPSSNGTGRASRPRAAPPPVGPKGAPSLQPQPWPGFRAAAVASTAAGNRLVTAVTLSRRASEAAVIHGLLELTPDGADPGESWPRAWATLTFRKEATESCPANNEFALRQYEDSAVCLEVWGRSSRSRVFLRMGRHEGKLVSSRRLITLREPLEEATGVNLYEVDRPSLGELSLVSFPLIGHRPLPGIDAFPDAPEFVNDLHLRPPDVLFHLAVRPAEFASTSTFGPLSERDVDRFADRLYLRMLPHGIAPAAYAVEPMEYVLGTLPDPGQCSPYAFAVPANPIGHSYELAVVTGILAAATRRALPPWVLLSAGIQPRSLQVTFTGDLERKIKLALGDGPVRENHERWLEELYRHRATATTLGLREGRSVPGRVKLFIVSTNTDTSPASLRFPMAAEPLSALEPGSFGQESFEDLLERVEALAGGGMLLVQVSTAFQALHLLGYHHAHPHIEFASRQELATFPLRVFRIRNEPAPWRVVAGGDVPPRRLGDAEYWEHLTQTTVATLDEELPKSDNIFRRLSILLETCIETINSSSDTRGPDRLVAQASCFSGDISIVSAERNWLRAVAVAGMGVNSMPFYVPSDIGITGRAIRTGRTAVVPKTADDPDYKTAVSPDSPVAQRYGYETLQGYRRFLEAIKSCVKVPLKRGQEVIGILCVHCDTEREFDPNLVRLLEALAARAAQEVIYLLGTEARPLSQEDGSGAVEQLARQLARENGSGATALRRLCNEVAKLVANQTGAYRAAVRLLTPEHNALRVAGHSGVWPKTFLERDTLLTEDVAATHAIEIGKSYCIQDTSQAYTREDGDWKPIHYRPYTPAANAHASVILRQGGHLLGVISVDWDTKGAINGRVQQALEQLASRVAVTLKALGAELLSTIEATDLAELNFEKLLEAPACAEPDFGRFLKAVAYMTGARQGAVFARRAETGRFHLVSSLLHPTWPGEDKWYEPGEGVTGWVLKRNRPLRITNLRDSAELTSVDPSDPPIWRDKFYDGEVRNDRNWTYMGVPASVGNDVLAVVRLANGINDVGFTSYDQAIVMAAAGRLAGVLYEREQARRMRTLTALAVCTARATTPTEVAAAVFEAIDRGVGSCTSWVRLRKALDRHDGQEALVPLAVSDPRWEEKTPPERLKGKGFAGTVWETGEMLVMQDADNDPRTPAIIAHDPQPNIELVNSFKSLACALLGGENPVGTLLVCREPRWAFSTGDLAFIREVVNLAGEAFRSLVGDA